MSARQARSFFLKPESYFRPDLPPYFDFRGLLRPVAAYLSKHPLNHPTRAAEHADVNYTLYSNKDGRYAWRPFALIHPALYVDLVHLITEPAAWEAITDRFTELAADTRMRCLSIPVASLTKRTDQGTQVLRWWHGIEQASISLALDFEFVFHADVADCYPSVYTHAVAWGLQGKTEAKRRKSDATLLGNQLDRRIQNMSHGQTNGIPQGSVPLDLVAELVLGYADLELSSKLNDVQDFQILRYRDDYRIFVNSTERGEAILRTLTEVLMGLGLRLNASKTTGFKTVVGASIKTDKWAHMRSRQSDLNLQKHLLLIHAHGTDFPNAGSLLAALDAFHVRVGRLKTVRDPLQLISIAVDIGYHNPRCFPVCAAIVSKLLSVLSSKKEKRDAVDRIRRKLKRLPNNGHLEVWLQRISYPIDAGVTYEERLCTLVQGTTAELWNSSWIHDTILKRLIDPMKVVNRRRLKRLRPVVPRQEVTLFAAY
jgi:hypothetical protein